MKSVFQFNFLLKEQTKNQQLISPTDRGISRLKKIIHLLVNFRKVDNRKVKFELDFQLSQKFMIQIINQKYIYDITKNIVKVLQLEVDGLAVVNNPALFTLPSETLHNALLRVIRLSVINVPLQKRKIQACIERSLEDYDEILCSDLSYKALNSVTLAILENLRISTVIIALESKDKCFPELENFTGNVIFFEIINSSGKVDSKFLEVCSSA